MVSIVEGQQHRLMTQTVFALRNILHAEGAFGLFRGIIPNLIGVVPSRGEQRNKLRVAIVVVVVVVNALMNGPPQFAILYLKCSPCSHLLGRLQQQ